MSYENTTFLSVNGKGVVFFLAKHCLEEFKLDCQLRRLTDRTIKGYYNNTLNFLTYAEKHHGITEVEEIHALHIKHYIQYLLTKKLTARTTPLL